MKILLPIIGSLVMLVCIPIIYELTLNVLDGFGVIHNLPRIKQLQNKIDDLLDVKHEKVFFLPLTLALITTPYLIHVLYILPFLYEVYSDSALSRLCFYIFHVCGGSYLELSMLFNFHFVVTNSPGSPNEDITDTDTELISSVCRHCNISRPSRTHHCSTCNKCILNFDHHCPFVANCVGLKNRRNFVLLLLFAALTASYAVYVTAIPHNICTRKIVEVMYIKPCESMGELSSFLIYIAIIAAIPLNIAFCFWIFLVSKGISLNDYLNYRYKLADIIEGKIISIGENTPRDLKAPDENVDPLLDVPIYINVLLFFGDTIDCWKLLVPLQFVHKSIRQSAQSRYQSVNKYLD